LTQRRNIPPIVITLFFTTLSFFVMGYHPGMEDDGVYLAAVKADLQPALFPHNADFFRLQLRLTLFDNFMAQFVRIAHIPLQWAELFWQFVSLFVILWAARRITAQLFPEAPDIFAQWAGVATLASMFTLPVAGTALNIADQHLHPRNIATALIVLAISCILERKVWQAFPLMLLAFAFHPLMAVFGLSFCSVLSLTLFQPLKDQIRAWRTRRIEHFATPAVAAVPFLWLFDPPSPTWLEAIHSRHWFRLYEWTWYEWLGAIAPLALFWIVSHVARRHGDRMLAQFATAILIYGVFHQAIAMILLSPESLVTLSALEPMRYLHLVYIFTSAGICSKAAPYAGSSFFSSSTAPCSTPSASSLPTQPISNFLARPRQMAGFRPSTGSGKTPPPALTSRSIPTTSPLPVRITTASARSLSAVLSPTP